MNASILTNLPAKNLELRENGLLKSTLYGGLISGVLDASFAAAAYVLVLKVYSLPGVLQYIASGLLGSSSFQGGLATAALGVAVHFFIAFAFALAFGLAARKLKWLTDNPVVSGLAYGAFIWLFMSFAVLPFSGVPQQAFDLGLFSAFLADHALLVGVPIALASRRFIRQTA